MVADQPRQGNGKRKRASRKFKKKEVIRLGLSIPEESILRAQLRGTGTGSLSTKVERDENGLEIERINLPRHDGAGPFPPSEPWVETFIGTYTDTGPEGQRIAYRAEITKRKEFPPGGTDTKMCLCVFCGRLVPREAMEVFRGPRRKGTGRIRRDEPDGELLVNGERHGETEDVLLCMDHKSVIVHREWGKSPSAKGIVELRERKVRLEQRELHRQTSAALQREVAFYERTGRVAPNNFSLPRQKSQKAH